jgi:hypothetical protein
MLLSSITAFASVQDTLRIDQSSNIELRKLPKNFKENYTSKEFVYEYNFDAHKKSIWEKFKIWITNKFKEWFGFVDQDKAASFTSNLFKIIYIIVFLLVLYFIIKTLINKEGNWIFGRNSDKINIEVTALDENVLETNYENLIQKAVNASNYRLAVRYYYLKTLKKLAESSKIEWEYEKTNLDYYNEIENKELKSQFQYISYIYNYCWYGEFELNNTAFNDAKTSFKTLFKSIN